jgi:hypothetical protein
MKRQFVYRKFFLLWIAVLPLFFGCATYGRYTPKTPVNKRCLVELDPNLTITGEKNIMWIGSWAGVTVINLPSGTQELGFQYKRKEYTFRSETREEWKEYKAGVGVKFDFEAGHHYRILANLRKEGNKAYVELKVEDLGTNTNMYHNGVFVGIMPAFEAHLGSGGLSYVMAGFGFGSRVVFDIGTPIELSLNGGGDFGIGPSGKYNPHTEYNYDVYPAEETIVYDTSLVSMPFGVYGGVFGHFYIPRTNISLGAGYGYRAELPILDQNSFYSPFVRGELLFNGTGLYFEYYTNPSYLSVFDSNAPDDFRIFKRWGVGIFGRI